VESADPSIALVSPNPNTAGTASIDIFLANGLTGTSFVVSGLEGVIGSSLITVSAPGFTGVSHTVNIQQAALDIAQLFTSIDTLDPADPFQVRIGLPAGGNTSVNRRRPFARVGWRWSRQSPSPRPLSRISSPRPSRPTPSR
jgi:hypothetical protein